MFTKYKKKIYNQKQVATMQKTLFVQHNYWDMMMYPFQEYKIQLTKDLAIITKI
jgi:hypothetical protein